MHSAIREAGSDPTVYPKYNGKLPLSLKQRLDVVQFYIVKRSRWQL